MHLAPLICLAGGYGLAVAVEWLAARLRPSRRLIPPLAAAGLLSLAGLGCLAGDLWKPCKTLSDERFRSFARWFWFSSSMEGVPVCVHDDLGVRYSPETFSELSWSAMYLCNKYIYSPYHQKGVPPPIAVEVGRGAPLRCVVYRDERRAFDQAALDRWLAEMAKTYEPPMLEIYPMPRYDYSERRMETVDHLEIYSFIPPKRPGGRRGRAGDVGDAGR
jgi:hypothetical protein